MLISNSTVLSVVGIIAVFVIFDEHDLSSLVPCRPDKVAHIWDNNIEGECLNQREIV